MTYSVRDLVQRYGITEHTVLAWIRSGELRAVNVGRTQCKKKPRWRITEEALQEFESRRSTGATPSHKWRHKDSSNDVIERY